MPYQKQIAEEVGVELDGSGGCGTDLRFLMARCVICSSWSLNPQISSWFVLLVHLFDLGFMRVVKWVSPLSESFDFSPLTEILSFSLFFFVGVPLSLTTCVCHFLVQSTTHSFIDGIYVFYLGFQPFVWTWWRINDGCVVILCCFFLVFLWVLMTLKAHGVLLIVWTVHHMGILSRIIGVVSQCYTCWIFCMGTHVLCMFEFCYW